METRESVFDFLDAYLNILFSLFFHRIHWVIKWLFGFVYSALFHVFVRATQSRSCEKKTLVRVDGVILSPRYITVGKVIVVVSGLLRRHLLL